MKFAELPIDIQKRILINNRVASILCQVIAQASKGRLSAEEVALRTSRDAIADVEKMTPEEMMAVMVSMDLKYERSQRENVEVLHVFIMPEGN